MRKQPITIRSPRTASTPTTTRHRSRSPRRTRPAVPRAIPQMARRTARIPRRKAMARPRPETRTPSIPHVPRWQNRICPNCPNCATRSTRTRRSSTRPTAAATNSPPSTTSSTAWRRRWPTRNRCCSPRVRCASTATRSPSSSNSSRRCCQCSWSARPR